jgi:hypothetical protein
VQRVIYGSLIVAVVACGSGAESSSTVITSLSLEASTEEHESGRWLLTVGDTGLVNVGAEQTSDCFFDSPCAASVQAQLRSRPGGLLSLSEATVTTPGQARFVGVAPGTAYVVASAQSFADSQRVDVVTTPLPVDSIQVRIQSSSYDESLESSVDGSGSLVAVTLPHPGSIPLDIQVFRGSSIVTQIPWSLESSASDVAAANKGCRPRSIDPQCDVVSSWGWITGLATGSATVIVAVRNAQKSISVTVQ